jgi:hypothetical protein
LKYFFLGNFEGYSSLSITITITDNSHIFFHVLLNSHFCVRSLGLFMIDTFCVIRWNKLLTKRIMTVYHHRHHQQTTIKKCITDEWIKRRNNKGGRVGLSVSHLLTCVELKFCEFESRGMKEKQKKNKLLKLFFFLLFLSVQPTSLSSTVVITESVDVNRAQSRA